MDRRVQGGFLLCASDFGKGSVFTVTQAIGY